MPPHVLHGVEFRRVGRQARNLDATAGASNVVADERRAVDGRAVPKDQQPARDVALEMAEEFDNLRSLDTSGMDLEVEAQERQSADDRKALPVEGFLQEGRLPSWRPGTGSRGSCAQTTFVDKDDQPALSAGFFFSAGHSTRFQWRMAGSFRSTARRSGR